MEDCLAVKKKREEAEAAEDEEEDTVCVEGIGELPLPWRDVQKPPPLALGRWPRCRPAAPAVAIRHRTRTRAKNDTDTRARPRSGARRRRTREAGPGDAAPLRSRAVTGVRAPARHSAVGLGR